MLKMYEKLARTCPSAAEDLVFDVQRGGLTSKRRRTNALQFTFLLESERLWKAESWQAYRFVYRTMQPLLRSRWLSRPTEDK